jgi:Na+/proline symporter
MRTIDLLVLAAFLVYIVWDGARHGRGVKDAKDYLLAGRRMRWWAMGLSVMATQASAITLISTTGQGFKDGMRFLHLYLAIPFAMVLLCATVVPWFHKAGVYTAYQWLETRFDRKTRVLASLVFLVSRALAVGSVLYTPSIVMSVGLGIPPWQSILAMGLLCTAYTAIGGATAVIVTDAKQMVVMMAGIVACIAVAWCKLPADVGLRGVLDLAGATGKLQTFHIPADWREMLADKYNLFSSLLGGFFLFLGYFGADQEQVQRYLAGSSVEQSRKSLLLSGFAKVPMQFVILLLGVLIWGHYSFRDDPPFFRAHQIEAAIEARAKSGDAAGASQLRTRLAELQSVHDALDGERQRAGADFLRLRRGGAESGDHALDEPVVRLRGAEAGLAAVRKDGMALLVDAGLEKEDVDNDSDYVFTHFLKTEVPVGVAGLVLAAIFAAAMSSLVSPINSLATSSVIDVWALLRSAPVTQAGMVRATRIATVVWGGLATLSAFWMGGVPIIEQVNKIGSVVYGSLFGVFILGRLVTRARGVVGAISLASGIAIVLLVRWFSVEPSLQTKWLGIAQPVKIEFMWFNLIGFVAVMAVGWLLSRFSPAAPPSAPAAR